MQIRVAMMMDEDYGFMSKIYIKQARVYPFGRRQLFSHATLKDSNT